MKKSVLLFAMLAAMLACVFTACGDPAKPEDPSLTLNQSTLTLDLGKSETETLVATLKGSEETVTFTSSDSTVCTVTNAGVVTPTGEGSATVTASAGALSDTCEVTVVDSVTMPVLTLSQQKVNLRPNGEITLTVSATYRGQAVTDQIAYVWTSEDQSVATVENGLIHAVGVGDTTVTVSATIYGKSVSKNVEVSVKEEIEISLSSETLALTMGTNETADVSLEVTDEEGPVTSGSFLWTTESDILELTNANTALVSVRATGKGTATLNVVYTSVGGIEYSASVSVTVSLQNVTVPGKTYVEKTASELQIDLDASVLVSVKIGEVTVPDCTLSGGKLSVPVTGDAVTAWGGTGEKTMLVETKTAEYSHVIVICDGIIETKDEYNAMWETADALAGTAGDLAYGGYWALGADIDFKVGSDNTVPTLMPGVDGGYRMDMSYVSKDNGFVGTFDGRGYAIKNFTLAGYGTGLFGSIGKSGLVKDLAILESQMVGGSNCGMLAGRLYGTVKDIYAQVYLNDTGSKDGFAGLVKLIESGAVMQNCLVYARVIYNTETADTDFVGAGGIWQGGDYSGISDVYLLSDDELNTNENRITAAFRRADIYDIYEEETDYDATLTRVKAYASETYAEAQAAMKADTSESKFDSAKWNAERWDWSTGIPVFRFAAAGAQ